MTDLTSLKATLDRSLLSALGDGAVTRVAMLDAPDYPNVGDPAILIGQIDFFRRHFPRVKFVFVSHRNYSEAVDAEIEKCDVLVLNGGGTFGDIWPAHQAFRLRMMRRFADRRMIQLPQSISFSDPAMTRDMADTIAAMKHFTLMTRDSKSYAFATETFDCTHIMSPDMAFAMDAISPDKPVLDFFCLLRTDKEVIADNSAAIRQIIAESGATYEIEDWLVDRRNVEKIHVVLRKLAKAGVSRRLIAARAGSLYEAYARSRLRCGISLLSRGQTVITDRLHGHILATLLGKNQIVFDSKDSKIKKFNETWLSDNADAVFLSDPMALHDHMRRSLADAA